jgi:hypothetical protein
MDHADTIERLSSGNQCARNLRAIDVAFINRGIRCRFECDDEELFESVSIRIPENLASVVVIRFTVAAGAKSRHGV